MILLSDEDVAPCEDCADIDSCFFAYTQGIIEKPFYESGCKDLIDYLETKWRELVTEITKE